MFAKFLQYCKKEVRDEVDFLDANKHQGFLLVDFNTLDIKVSYKVILYLLLCIIKHSQNTQSNKLAISLQCLKIEVRDGVHFWLALKFLQVCTIASDGGDMSKVPNLGSW